MTNETSPSVAPVARPSGGVVYVSGAFRAAADAGVSVFDHGLLYGDGVFEGIRAYNGRVFKLERHIDRLFDSAKAIRLEIPNSYAEVCELVVETCRRNAPDATSPSIKSLNYLNNILARIEANDRGADEALMLDAQGYVAEATVDNFFIVIDHSLLTPPTATNVKGVTRETLLSLAASLGITTEEKPFTLF